MALGLVVGCGALCTYTNYLSLLVPENSADNILRRRAQRLRKRTGHLKLKSKSELAQTNLPLSEAIRDALIKPMEICQRSCCDLQQNLGICQSRIYPAKLDLYSSANFFHILPLSTVSTTQSPKSFFSTIPAFIICA